MLSSFFRHRFKKQPDDKPAAVTASTQTHDIPAYCARVDLSSISEYKCFEQQNPEYFSESCENTILSHVRLHGVQTLFLHRIGPDHVYISGDEPREGLVTCGVNSRMRAVLDALVEYEGECAAPSREMKIYAPEAVTDLALLLRGRYPKYIGTEYCQSKADRDGIFPILHGDVLDLDFPDGSFDVYISCEVLEHVPDIDVLLSEAARILKKGGRFIATFPFLVDYEDGVKLAEMIDGEVVHRYRPIFHGNPMDPSGGALVFEVPGWDIIDRAKAAGFTAARMQFVCDQNKGIVAGMRDPIGAKLSRENFPNSHCDFPEFDPEGTTPKGVFVALFDK